MRSGVVHGEIRLKYTGFPRYEAASTRSGNSGCPGQIPSHAARASVTARGVHCGGADLNWVASSPAAANRLPQFGGGAASVEVSSCGGTASSLSRCPCVSRDIRDIPEIKFGGLSSLIRPHELSVTFDMNPGLSRYQNPTVGGTPEDNLLHRARLRSFFSM